jgi:hypothetical protein
MSDCGCGSNEWYGDNGAYNGYCNADTPYPSVSHESVPSLIDNLVNALYGAITKDVSGGKVVWNIPCDPSKTATVFGIARNSGEGLLCYFIRAFNAANNGGGTFNGSFIGPLTGNVTGNVTGNLTGNVTGNVSGNVSGNAETATTATRSTNIVGGALNSIPYQTAANTTGLLPAGTNGQVLGILSGVLQWVSAPAAATASALAGGSAGQVPWQIGSNATGFTAAGTTGQVLTSNGTSAPTWSLVSPTSLSAGAPTWNANGDLNAQRGLNPSIQAVPNAANGIGVFNAYATNALNAIVGQIQMYCSTGAAFVSSVFNLPLVFATNNAERMRITAEGNVGIGTSSPNARLDIQSGTGESSLRLGPSTAQGYFFGSATSAGFYSPTGAYLEIGRNSANISMVGTINTQGNPITNCRTTAKAFVNFDGTGTPSIRSSYNVSSITKNGTGDYTVNFATPMADANYSIVLASKPSFPDWPVLRIFAQTISSTRVEVGNRANGVPAESSVYCVQIFGN